MRPEENTGRNPFKAVRGMGKRGEAAKREA